MSAFVDQIQSSLAQGAKSVDTAVCLVGLKAARSLEQCGASRVAKAPAKSIAYTRARAFGALSALVGSIFVLGLVKSAIRVSGQVHERIASRCSLAIAPIAAGTFASALGVMLATVGALWVLDFVVAARIASSRTGRAARDTLAKAPCRASALT